MSSLSLDRCLDWCAGYVRATEGEWKRAGLLDAESGWMGIQYDRIDGQAAEGATPVVPALSITVKVEDCYIERFSVNDVFPDDRSDDPHRRLSNMLASLQQSLLKSRFERPKKEQPTP